MDAVAASLQRGDACRARAQAIALRSEVSAAIGQVPGPLQEDLSSGANILLDMVPPCLQPAAGGDEGFQHGKHKDKRKGEEGD